MIQGSAFASSHIPQTRQCRDKTARASSNISEVGREPCADTSTTTGGFFANALIGPITLSRQNALPFRSRTIQKNIITIASGADATGIFMHGITCPRVKTRRFEREYIINDKRFTKQGYSRSVWFESRTQNHLPLMQSRFSRFANKTLCDFRAKAIPATLTMGAAQ
jgi:hypothetical protein